MPEDPTGAGDVAAAYDSWAATYDADRNPTRDLDAEVLRESGLAIAGRDVLELGCGTGKNTRWLAEHARSVIAFDFSPSMIAYARERVRKPHVRFIEHDLRLAWPVPGERVDVVVVNLVLEHIEDLAPIYREAARVLRPGGQFFLCELHPERQRAGGQAEFVDRSSGETVRVAAYQHTIAEFVNGGVDAGLDVRRIGEHIESGAAPRTSPRLLSILFERVTL